MAIKCSRQNGFPNSHYRVECGADCHDENVQVTHGADSYMAGFTTFIPRKELVVCGCGKWREATDAEYARSVELARAYMKVMKAGEVSQPVDKI